MAFSIIYFAIKHANVLRGSVGSERRHESNADDAPKDSRGTNLRESVTTSFDRNTNKNADDSAKTLRVPDFDIPSEQRFVGSPLPDYNKRLFSKARSATHDCGARGKREREIMYFYFPLALRSAPG